MRPSVRLRPVGWVERQRSAFPPSISHKGNSDRLVMTTVSEEDEDETLAHFLESEILSSDYPDDNHKEHTKTTATDSSPPLKKKLRLNDDKDKGVGDGASSSNNIAVSESGKIFSMIPPEVFHHILKFLSSEDLIACSLVCKFLNLVASDECLWHRLYCMRWGLASPTKKLRECTWKELYIQRDEEDMFQFVRNTPTEFKEYYIQMQVAKRSQAPLPSQVNDDRIILDKTVADQVSMWRVSRGLTDEVVAGHACSGDTCSYYQIGNVFLCEKTGRVHVCGDTCREVLMDTNTGLWVCTVSGHCFDTVLSPTETEPDAEQGGVTDETEPFMGSGRFARAYVLGYDCVDEKELEAALRFC